MKKLISLFLAAAMVLCIFAGAGVAMEAKAEEATTINVWIMHGESEEPTHPSNRYQKLVDDFNASHTDIQIKLTVGKNYDTIVTSIAGSSTPDIFQMFWQYAPGLADNGAILELTDYVKNDAEFDYDDFLPSVWNLCSVGESIYSIPITASTTYILYNPKVLAEHGWDHFPTDMAEFEQCAKDCYVEGEVMGFDPVFPWRDDVLWPVAFGAEWEDENGEPAFDNEAMREAYAFQKRLIDFQGGFEAVSAWGTDYNSTRCTTADPVLTGKAAMRFNGDSGLAGFEGAANELGLVYGVDYAIAPLPASMLTAGVFEINAKTANPDAAWTVMAYLNSKEAMAYLCEGEFNRGAFMPRKSALDALAAKDVSNSVKEACTLLKDGELRSFPMSGYVNEYLSAIGTYMSEYLNGNIDMDEAVAGVMDEAKG